MAGFRYCDWLLAPAERAAWQHLLHQPGARTDRQSVALTVGQDLRRPERRARRVHHTQEGSEFPIADDLAEVERRATTILKWAVDNNLSLLTIALDDLTLARVGLIRAILGDCPNSGTDSLPVATSSGIEQHSDSGETSPPNDAASLLATPLSQPTLALPHVATAVDGLRAAGMMDHLPRGLLTAALYRYLRGEHELAEKHLAETQQIAERGPMPLFLADVHLHRARMFRDRSELAKAAALIRDLGYGRRYEELADAEAAANQWSN